MQIPSPRSKKRARIEIIPLIDVMFFLLCIFVMLSLSMIKNLGINVKLPTASTSVPLDHKDFVVITVTESGQYNWNKDLILQPELVLKLQQLKSNNPESKIFINGDAHAHFENVVSVLDEARRLGFSKVAIQTVKS